MAVLIAGTPAAACLDVSALPQLKTLCMARCALRQMPIGVYASTGLRSIDVSSNSIAEVRTKLVKLIRHFARPRDCTQPRCSCVQKVFATGRPRSYISQRALRVLAWQGLPYFALNDPCWRRCMRTSAS